jgi:hypothetical protein
MQAICKSYVPKYSLVGDFCSTKTNILDMSLGTVSYSRVYFFDSHSCLAARKENVSWHAS